MHSLMKILIIGSTWVEPKSTAAGSRMLQLLQLFANAGYGLTYATAAADSAHSFDLSSLGIEQKTISLNDDGFDDFVSHLQPDIVLFDRFIAEEQYGWRVADQCPKALLVLDTEDLHCLRKARQTAIKEDRSMTIADLMNDVAKREIASIYRCDLTLMISKYEMKLLASTFQLPSVLLHYVPFLVEPLEADFVPYEERQDFISIGNFLHAPNWDATRYLKQTIWPLIRKELPQANLQIYGAYPSDKVWQLHDPTKGFLVKGRAEDAHQVISKAKVLLAPLRFGAGLKGKLLDAMQSGTPSVTTIIGAEGMYDADTWCGQVADQPSAFAKAAIALYTDAELWHRAQAKGVAIVNSCFQKTAYEGELLDRLLFLKENLPHHREANFTGQMLHFHQLRSTKFMSKWIALKNKS